MNKDRSSLSPYSPNVRESRFRNPGNFFPFSGIRNHGKFCFWNTESWALESGIELKESGIPLTIGI